MLPPYTLSVHGAEPEAGESQYTVVVALYSISKDCVEFSSFQSLWILMLSLVTPSHICFLTLNKQQKHISMQFTSVETKHEDFLYLG